MVAIRVGVIGAGAAGLCAGRNMVHSPDKFEFVIFEQWGEVGGTWNYTDMTDVDEYQLPIHSSMYRTLKYVILRFKGFFYFLFFRTNVPKEIMGYPDFPFPQSGHSFTHHSSVLDYLKSYAKVHKLYDKIKVSDEFIPRASYYLLTL